MINSTEHKGNEKTEREARAKAAMRVEQASIVTGLQKALEGDEQLLGFARGRISGGLRGKLNIGPEAFFAPHVNIGLTERRIILQHIHAETGRPSEILPHFFALGDIMSIGFSEIETFGEEPAGRLTLRLNNDQHFRIRITGEGNFEGAKTIVKVFQSLTTLQRATHSPTQRMCAACKHILDQPFHFCPYCGATQEETPETVAADVAEPPASSPKEPEIDFVETEVEKVTVVVSEPPIDLLEEALSFVLAEPPVAEAPEAEAAAEAPVAPVVAEAPPAPPVAAAPAAPVVAEAPAVAPVVETPEIPDVTMELETAPPPPIEGAGFVVFEPPTEAPEVAPPAVPDHAEPPVPPVAEASEPAAEASPAESTESKQGPLKVHVKVDRPQFPIDEVFIGEDANDVVGKMKPSLLPYLPFPTRLMATSMSEVEFVQEVIRRYNQEEQRNLPLPTTCREFLTLFEVLGFATVEDVL